VGIEVARLQRVATATRALAEASLDPERLLDTIAQQLADVIGDTCSVMLVSDDDASLVQVALADRDPEVLSRAATMPPWAREPIESPQIATLEQLQTTPGLHAIMRLPLRVSGKAIGQLVLSRHRASPRAFDDADREIATIVADHAALAIEHMRVLRAARTAEADRNAIEAALQVANRELESFSYSVAHDLKAPLRGVNGFSRLLVESYGDKLDDEGRDWLGEIQKNATKMGALIDALLGLSRLSRSELRLSPIDLSALVREAADALASAEPDRKVEVEIEGAIEVEVDISLVRVLVANLVGNAWKFTRMQPQARIAFGELSSAAGRTFYIRDNGAGFDARYADKLFAPFQRLHAVTEFPGTGIGLAAAQRIAHRHGGRVWAEAVVGAGATFFFTFRPAGDVLR
jgi:signal transduction histidine kinase